MKKLNVKPSRFLSVITFIMGIIFCLIGIFYVIPNFKIFGIIWTILAFLITIYYGINAFTKKGISLYSVTIEDKEDKK